MCSYKEFLFYNLLALILKVKFGWLILKNCSVISLVGLGSSYFSKQIRENLKIVCNQALGFPLSSFPCWLKLLRSYDKRSVAVSRAGCCPLSRSHDISFVVLSEKAFGFLPMLRYPLCRDIGGWKDFSLRSYDNAFVVTSYGQRVEVSDVTTFLLSCHRKGFLRPRRCYDTSLSGSRRIR